MAVRGYVNDGKYFCVEHFRANTGDQPMEDPPDDAICNRCERLLNVVVDGQERQ